MTSSYIYSSGMVENRLFTIPHFCVRSSGLRASPQLWAAILASLKCTKKTGDGDLLLGTFETNMRARNKKRSVSTIVTEK